MSFELTQAYKAYIYSDKWKAKTRIYWKTHGRFCQACGSTQKLHVHHMDYANFGHEPMADLAGVCDKCHRAIHAEHRSSGRQTSLRVVTLRYIQRKRMEKRKG